MDATHIFWAGSCAQHTVRGLAAQTTKRCGGGVLRPTRSWQVTQATVSRRKGAAPRQVAPGFRRTATPASGSYNSPSEPLREEHKIFDEVVITVRSGKGGDGEISQSDRGKWVTNHKYRPGGNLPKQIWVASGSPADGCEGGSVILRADPMVDSLTHLHSRSIYAASNGSKGNPAMGSSGPKSTNTRSKHIKQTQPLVLSVPMGTEVRKKRGNWLVGELLKPGDTLVVARGGRGGMGVVAPSRRQKVKKSARAQARAVEEGYEEEIVEDLNWRADSYGQEGEESTLRLMLRVVADIGIVGLPNAGKSSLLAAITKARPAVAPYPFTTLMPNLGVMQAGGGSPVLADLPGLIHGAHEGRGLGFMFLRHLRRTRALMHVLDAANEDPVSDYFAVLSCSCPECFVVGQKLYQQNAVCPFHAPLSAAATLEEAEAECMVREELRMYNPQYTARPHVVVLNKMDMEDAFELEQELRAGIVSISNRLKVEHDGRPSLPSAIIATCAVDGSGVEDLVKALKQVLGFDPASQDAVDDNILAALRESGIDVDKLNFEDI